MTLVEVMEKEETSMSFIACCFLQKPCTYRERGGGRGGGEGGGAGEERGGEGEVVGIIMCAFLKALYWVGQ